jgi:hypothetical protein
MSFCRASSTRTSKEHGCSVGDLSRVASWAKREFQQLYGTRSSDDEQPTRRPSHPKFVA